MCPNFLQLSHCHWEIHHFIISNWVSFCLPVFWINSIDLSLIICLLPNLNILLQSLKHSSLRRFQVLRRHFAACFRCFWVFESILFHNPPSFLFHLIYCIFIVLPTSVFHLFLDELNIFWIHKILKLSISQFLLLKRSIFFCLSHFLYTVLYFF